jgi:hypothetical protein
MAFMTIETDILIVIASVVVIFAFSSSVAGWVDRSWPVLPMIALGIALGLLAYVHLVLREGGLSFWAIPDAFIHVVAMVLR